MSRLEKLEKLLADDPNDVFLHYALATEILKSDNLQAAEERFQLIHERFPDYVPAWFRHAQAAAEQGRTGDARTLGLQGLEVAKRVGDMHAAGEISEFLELLP